MKIYINKRNCSTRIDFLYKKSYKYIWENDYQRIFLIKDDRWVFIEHLHGLVTTRISE